MTIAEHARAAAWTPCIYWPGCGAIVEGGCADCSAELEEDFGDWDDDDQYPGEDIDGPL